MSVVTILPECKHGLKTNTPTSSMKSMDSLYTSSSSKFSALNRRKSNQRNRDRASGMIPVVSEIKQRVISARLLRMKQLQNQIGESHHKISELTAENRALKSLHNRQNSALSKYESSSAELPKLLNSHAEEVRVWQTRCRNLQRQNKDLISKIKQKDTIILTVTDQNKHLLQLNKDKNLEEREKLADRVKDLEQRLLDKDSDMKLLARRLQLESKSYKSNLHMEQQKYRDLLTKIEMSDFMLQRGDNGDKKSPTKPHHVYRVKSPVRAVPKSATSLHNGDKDHAALVLPPCDGPETKKQEETLKTNSPRINTNVKLLPGSRTDDDEVDLTKNRIDKSTKNGPNNHDPEDEITVTIRNGMNRAKAPQKPTKATAKLTPLHPKRESKQSSDDSESDDGFQLFSEHNGTKMAHNARDLLDHKMHLTELESKMKQNSLDSKKHAPSSSSCSSLSDHQLRQITATFDDIPAHSFNDRNNNDLANIQREMRNSMIRRESLLDDYCDTLVDEKSAYSSASTSTLTKVKKLELDVPAAANCGATNHVQTKTTGNTNYYGKPNGSVVGGKSIDPKKKNTLLAALKDIDDEN